jgi:hypothetical protein
VPEDHLESELFGTVRGAFPGAIDKRGALEHAQGGVVFFDEIAVMRRDHQAKILRVIEGKPFRRVGGVAPITVDVAVIAAAHEDLATLAALLNGKTAMAQNWAPLFGDLPENPDASSVVGKIAYAVVPSGSAGQNAMFGCQGTGINASGSGSSAAAFVVPDQVPGWLGTTGAEFAAQLDQGLGLKLASDVILGDRPESAPAPTQAELAVIAGSVRFPPSVESRDLAPLYGQLLPEPGSPAALAARRFAALTPAARHAWLAQHLTALRAGHVSQAQLP